MNLKWNFFVTAAILVGGLLIKFGVPAESVLGGIGLAGLLNWRETRRLRFAEHRQGK